MNLTDKELKEIAIMKQSGVFDYSGGVAFIYRDPMGTLKAIKIELNTFRKGKIMIKPEVLEWLVSLKNDTLDKKNNCSIVELEN